MMEKTSENTMGCPENKRIVEQITLELLIESQMMKLKLSYFE